MTWTNQAVEAIASQFAAPGKFIGYEVNRIGHINDTLVCTFEGGRTILQRVNGNVFKRPAQLMENVVAVISHLHQKIRQAGGDPLRETLTLIPTRDGKMCFQDGQGHIWRMFVFIEGTVTYQKVERPQLFTEAGRAFGRFQQMLADFPAAQLDEVIPGFHDTVKRYEAFEQAVAQDLAGRGSQVQAEIAFVRARKADAGRVMALLAEGTLPTRVTHNDTKLNNVMIDAKTDKAVCVVDLDTVMPGSLLFDFGDAIRSGATTAEEDETDLDKVNLDLGLYQAFAKGFLSETGDAITPEEEALLPFSAKLLTYECGMRFLTDYLNGDTYFHVDRPQHNLDRARNQFKLVEQLEEQAAQMLLLQRS